MKIKHLPRPRNQRAFVSWLAENYPRFAVSVRINRITATSVTLIFPDYPACLTVSLCSHSLNVVVDWQGLNWDMLISLDAYIARTVNGYQCQLCIVDDTESPQLFPSREALWIDHLYEPFLKWVNEELASARWLEISGFSDGGATWAHLAQADSDLETPDRTLQLTQKLVRLDGKPARVRGEEEVLRWRLPLGFETGAVTE